MKTVERRRVVFHKENSHVNDWTDCTDSAHCSGVSIFDFEQVKAYWKGFIYQFSKIRKSEKQIK